MLFPTFSSLLFLLILFQNTSSNGNLPHNHIHHQTFHKYFRGTTASQVAQNINSVYGDGSTSERTCQVWYKRFRNGDISLEDQPCSRKPIELSDEALINLLKEDNRQTTHELAKQLGEGGGLATFAHETMRIHICAFNSYARTFVHIHLRIRFRRCHPLGDRGRG